MTRPALVLLSIALAGCAGVRRLPVRPASAESLEQVRAGLAEIEAAAAGVIFYPPSFVP